MTDTAIAASGAHAVFATLLEARTGQSLGSNRAWRLETALRPLLRDCGLDTPDALALDLLDGRHPGLAERVVEALLNQETSFFRDPAVLTMAAEAIGTARTPRQRIWCAGCSTGQEPLSLAILFAERGREVPEIVATDWSEVAIARGRSGRYNQFEIQRGLSTPRMIRWFDGAGGDWVARPELSARVQFRRGNLIADPAPPGQFDAVFCRNVLFYLAPAARRAVLTRLAGALRPDGVLVLGAGETVIGQSDAFQPSPRFRGLYEQVARPWPPREACR
ncbi:CheR family methyltransferase [Sphingomonas bacterium]|uniref:CheR family methyltransferase n=1 Tax=Sphingomonas bacterium TaxID=1895847 RepID=UPI001575114D|nr:protein-glutamate O-methyltransferase CheR [Sphingomonas bacterium]